MDTRRLSALFLLSSLIALLAFALVRGAPDDDARAAFALCQSKPAATTCHCTGPENCLCGDDCECPACAEAKDALHYRDAYFSAMNTRRQLVLWIGDAQCLPCQQKLSECVHVRLQRWDRDPTGRVIVCRPVGQQLVIVQSFEGLPDFDRLKEALASPTPVVRGGEAPAVCATCSH